MQSEGMSDLQSQAVLYDLRSRIASGDLRGGDKLRASHLAQQMSASRTPISEALNKLEAEGLVVRDKSGFTVRQFRIEEVFDAIDLRGMLEGAAVQKAAERGIELETSRNLRRLLQRMDIVITRCDFADYDALNDEFHRRLIAASGSKLLQEEVARSYRFPFAGPSAFPTRASESPRFLASIQTGQAQHHNIVNAIEQRQGARAFALMCEHARLAHHNVTEALATRPALPQLAMVAE